MIVEYVVHDAETMVVYIIASMTWFQCWNTSLLNIFIYQTYKFPLRTKTKERKMLNIVCMGIICMKIQSTDSIHTAICYLVCVFFSAFRLFFSWNENSSDRNKIFFFFKYGCLFAEIHFSTYCISHTHTVHARQFVDLHVNGNGRKKIFFRSTKQI